jgi:hypothetical protein
MMKAPMFSVLVTFFGFVAEVAWAQSPLPTSGIQLSVRPEVDVRFPLTVAQCESTFIYYNSSSFGNRIVFYRPDIAIPRDQDIFLSVLIPRGIGYLEWVCDIPEGHSFFVAHTRGYYVVVDPGSSSCLHNVTTTYSEADYNTTLFVSYTANPPVSTVTTAPDLLATYAVSDSGLSCHSLFASSTLPFPTGSFSTRTVK